MTEKNKPVSLGKYRNGHFEAKIQNLEIEVYGDEGDAHFEITLESQNSFILIPAKAKFYLDPDNQSASVKPFLLGEDGLFTDLGRSSTNEKIQLLELPLSIEDFLEEKEISYLEIDAKYGIQGMIFKKVRS